MALFYLLVGMLPFYHSKFVNNDIGGLSVVKYVGIACALAGIFYLPRRRSVPGIFATAQGNLFLLLTAWALISYVRLVLSGVAVSEDADVYYSLLLLFFVTLTMVDTWTHFRRAIIASVFSLGLASLYLLREYRMYGGMYADFRPGFATGDPNYYASSALVVLPLAYVWFQTDRRRFWKLAALGTLLLMLAGLGLTASRGGLLGLAVMLLFMVARERKQRLRNLAIAALAVAVLSLVPHGPVDRLLHPGYGDENGVEARLNSWTMGLKMVRDHPLAGVGLAQFAPTVLRYDPQVTKAYIAHNTYLEYAAELGIPALLVFLFLLGATFLTLGRIRRLARRSRETVIYNFAGAMQAGLVGFAVSSFFLSAEYQKVFWFLVFMTVPLQEIARRAAAQAAQERSRKTEPEGAALAEAGVAFFG
jgi:O-antigen ligase